MYALWGDGMGYYGLLMPIPYNGGTYIQSIRQTKTAQESEEDNEITVTLTNNRTEKFYIKNGGRGETGAAAGFGEVTAEVNPLGIQEAPTAEVSVSGDDTAKNIAFTFGMPRGAVIEAAGLFGLYIDNGTGDLMLAYSGEEAPALSLDGNGELIYTY